MPFIRNKVDHGKNFFSSKYQTKSKNDFDSQLLKAIKLLELNNIDLDNYLQQEILDNPLLEKAADDQSLKDNINGNDENLSSQDKSESSFSHNEDSEVSPSFDTVNLYESSSTSIDNIIEETIESKNSLYQIITDQINISFQIRLID